MITYSPRHRVLVREFTDYRVKNDLSDDVIAISTNKAYGRAAGNYQIVLPFVLIDGRRYDELIEPNDIIDIELAAGDGTDMEHVIVGPVDRVARTTHYGQDGIPRKTITISGRDFGKFLTNIELGWDMSGIRRLMEYGTGADAIVSAYLPRYQNQRGTPKELIEWLLQLFREQVPNAYYPKYINSKINTDDTWVTYDPTMVGIRGTDVWSAMKRLENAPYNILTTRTEKDGKFYIVLERNPLDEQGKLVRDKFHLIDDTLDEDVGVSDHERINLLCLWPPTFKTITNAVLDIALAYPDTTRYSVLSPILHGFAPKIIEAMYVPKSFWITEKEDPDDLIAVKDRADLFWAWYKDNHTYESGVFRVHGRPNIRPGDGIVHTGYNKQYLVEQLTHDYAVFPVPRFVTSLQVTRGQPH